MSNETPIPPLNFGIISMSSPQFIKPIQDPSTANVIFLFTSWEHWFCILLSSLIIKCLEIFQIWPYLSLHLQTRDEGTKYANTDTHNSNWLDWKEIHCHNRKECDKIYCNCKQSTALTTYCGIPSSKMWILHFHVEKCTSKTHYT